MLTLRPEFKAAWLAALRSGNYVQGQQCLRQPEADAFCCLGVACDLTVKIDPQLFEWEASGFFHTFISDGGRLVSASMDEYVLPFEVQEQMFYLDSFNPADYPQGTAPAIAAGPLPFLQRREYPGQNKIVYLTDANDAGCTFAQIADLIEYWY